MKKIKIKWDRFYSINKGDYIFNLTGMPNFDPGKHRGKKMTYYEAWDEFGGKKDQLFCPNYPDCNAELMIIKLKHLDKSIGYTLKSKWISDELNFECRFE